MTQLILPEKWCTLVSRSDKETDQKQIYIEALEWFINETAQKSGKIQKCGEYSFLRSNV